MAFPTIAEINGMKKDELKDALTNLVNNGIGTMFQTILDEIKEEKNEIKVLKDEIIELKSQNEMMRKELNDTKSLLTTLNSKAPQDPELQPSSFAEVVRKSVQSVIDDNKTENEVIITKVDEKVKDQKFVTDLCAQIDFGKKPNDIVRLGRKQEGQRRPLKVTFPCPFDARTFRARFHECQKAKSDIPKVRVRPCLGKEEHTVFKKSSAVAFKLNTDARNRGQLDVSYSLRNDGEIWKFQKGSDGRWTRDQGWSLADEKKSGN